MPFWLPLVLVLLLAGVVVVLGTAAYMAHVLLRPPRMSDGKAAWVLKRISPGDLGLQFQSRFYSVRDARTGQMLKLAAWWIPNPNAQGRCIVLLHGYADAKVGAIAWAPLLHELGWNILVPDLRAHGESEGVHKTAGLLERHDVSQIIDQLRAERPNDTRRVVLFGLSFGAAVAAGTAALRDDLAGVVLESPFPDYRRTEMRFCELMGYPGRWMQGLVLRLVAWQLGSDGTEIAPVRLIPELSAPVLVVVGEADPYLQGEALADLEAALQRRQEAGRPTAYLKIPAAGHLMAYPAEPSLYRQEVGRFLGDF